MEESELRNTAPEYDPKPCPLCGRTMRRGLIQSGGVLYFTDEEKYWTVSYTHLTLPTN